MTLLGAPGPFIPAVVPPISNVTPFTTRDLYTFQRILYALIDYTNSIGLNVDAKLQATIDSVNAALQTQTDYVNQTVEDLVEYVDAAVDSIINNSIVLQDPVMKTILSDISSQSRVYLNTIYAGKSVETAVASLTTSVNTLNALVAEPAGRLSVTKLDSFYGDQAVADRISAPLNTANATKTALRLFDSNGRALRQWLAACMSRDLRATMMVIGDSTSEGQGSTAYYDSWPHVLKRYLQAQFGSGGAGEGFIPAIRGFTGTGAGADQWTFTGSPTINRTDTNISGFGRRSVTLASGQSASHTFFGDKARLMFTGFPGAANVNIVVDGGAPVSFPVAQPTDVVSGIAYTTGTLTRGFHTITVSPVGSTMTLDGGVFYDDDSLTGIEYYDASHAGFTAADFNGDNNNVGRWAGGMATANPDLVLISLGTNDAKDATLSANFGANLAKIIDFVRSKGVTPSIGIVLQPTPGIGTTQANWDNMMAQAIAVAYTKGAAIIDMRERMRSGPSDNVPNLIYDGWNHPNTAGYTIYAQTIGADLGLASPKIEPQIAQAIDRSTAFSVTATSATALSPEVSVQVEVPLSGEVLVTMSGRMKGTGATLASWLSFTATGANTIAASATNGVKAYNVQEQTEQMQFLIRDLAPGITKFNLVAWVAATNTLTLTSAAIMVQPLP